jgi:pyruvate/2-oxoglutarate dehydrogenase complex dihydrolipoamide acyltransferase (E2) component
MELRMPKLGMEMTEGILSCWLTENGSWVEAGQPIYEVETEKIENEVTSPAAGTITRLADPGETYPVGALLGRIETDAPG